MPWDAEVQQLRDALGGQDRVKLRDALGDRGRAGMEMNLDDELE